MPTTAAEHVMAAAMSPGAHTAMPLRSDSAPSSCLDWLELQRRPVHAVPQAGGARPVVKHVAQVAKAPLAPHLQCIQQGSSGWARDMSCS